MKTATQDIKIGTELELLYSAGINHFRLFNSVLPLCGAELPAIAFFYPVRVVSSALLQSARMMHRVKLKTDCLKCAQALFNAIHASPQKTAIAGTGCALQAT